MPFCCLSKKTQDKGNNSHLIIRDLLKQDGIIKDVGKYRKERNKKKIKKIKNKQK